MYTYIHMYIYTHQYMYICMYTHISIYAHVYMHISEARVVRVLQADARGLILALR